MGNITNMEAFQKWEQLPKELKKKIIDNVFCSECLVTTIIDYNITLTKDGFVLLKGKCVKCRSDIARVVD